MQDKIKSIMAEILAVEEEDIGPTFSPEDAGSWDSLNNLKMITALEEEFDIQLTMDDITKMESFSAIVETIQRYLE